jgi:hypothetical protein
MLRSQPHSARPTRPEGVKPEKALGHRVSAKRQDGDWDMNLVLNFAHPPGKMLRSTKPWRLTAKAKDTHHKAHRREAVVDETF